MSEIKRIYKEKESQVQQPSFGLDPKLIMTILIKNWYVFVITIFVGLFGARYYIGHTMPVYESWTTLLVHESGDRSLLGDDQILQGLGLPASMRNLDNQIHILKSRDLTERTLKELSFEINYYQKTIRNIIPFYPDVPVKIFSETGVPLPWNLEFSITHLGDNSFLLKSESEFYDFNKRASFGETIEMPGGNFRVVCLNEDWFLRNKDKSVFFVVNDPVRLVGSFSSRLSIEPLSRSGTVLKISMASTNSARDVDFLNKFTEVYQSISLDRKNLEANRRIQFIDDQLVGISDSLMITESRLQQFRSANRVMDLSAQGQAIIGQATALENEKARLNLEASYYDYLADYLAKDVVGELPIVPITMGINDPTLTSLVTTLADLQGQLSSRQAGELNPLQSLLAQRVRSTKDALRETLNGLRRANSLALSENEKQISRLNSQAATLPATERQLLGFERKFRLNDELYTFLMQMRSEQQMQKASNMPDSEVLDPADQRFNRLVAPNRTMILFGGLFAGSAGPFLLILLIHFFNKKLKEEDIEGISNLPVIGQIPRNGDTMRTVALDLPNSSIAEAYRLMRSRMEFFIKNTSNPVILVTSSMPEEGKTFTAINLASVYSLLGRRTILVGFDLRKPKIYEDFNLDNEKGVSTWLIGRDSLEEIIKPTSYENLFIIPAGPVPPNPSELISSEKTSEFINILKEKFDYIIIDSSPMGIVSDTHHLAALSDTLLLVVRPGKTLRDLFAMTLNEASINGIKGLGLVINGVRRNKSHYGYGHKYGYTNDMSARSRFRVFGKKKAKKQPHN